MKKIILNSHGKINLSLDVLYKRDDNYHEIESVMQEISLKDILTFTDREKDILIEVDNPQVPVDFHNLVYRVWEKMKLYTGIDRGIHIKIEKNIPVSAGLAGGSSNAAATFKAINQLWELNMSDRQLMELGISIGADVPFCIMGGTALARGIGEKLTTLKSFRDVNILLCNPGIEISTAYAYSKLNLKSKRLNTKLLLEAIDKGHIENVAKNIGNKMEDVIIEKYPIIEEIKDSMIEGGALNSLMSGSGSTVFGIFKDLEKMKLTEARLLKVYPLTYSCKTI